MKEIKSSRKEASPVAIDYLFSFQSFRSEQSFPNYHFLPGQSFPNSYNNLILCANRGQSYPLCQSRPIIHLLYPSTPFRFVIYFPPQKANIQNTKPKGNQFLWVANPQDNSRNNTRLNVLV